MASAIQAIDQSSIHRLTSGQVVIDLQTAVKELVENALDAGATSIEVRFKEHGIESFEVQDNGRGIDQQDWPGIALKHHTSKLTTFADLTSVATLGFRGEALSSLCGTATLSIITSTVSTSPAGTSLTFSSNGECIVGGKVARSPGTTVTVKELFRALPVRRNDLIKNSKREFGKALELLQSYALIKMGCRFEVKNLVKGKWTTHLQTQAAASLRTTFSALFSTKSLTSIMDLDLELSIAPDKSVLKWSEGKPPSETRVVVKGLISKPTTGSGRTSGNRQFFYINGRPFAPTKIARTFNEVYKSFNTGSFPCVVADFQLPPDAYDVNVSPDKRTIFLHSEGHLLAALKSELENLFQPSRSTFTMTPIAAPTAKGKSKAQATEQDSEEEDEDEEEADTNSPEVQDEGEAEEKEAKAEDRPFKRRRTSPPEDEPVSSPPQSSPSGPFPSDPASSVAKEGEAEANAEDDRPSSPTPIDEDTSPAKSLPVSRSPSPGRSKPRRLSPSPPLPESIKLRQVTLDTTVASWSKVGTSVTLSTSSKSKRDSKSATLRAKIKSLRTFVHPSQVARFIDDEAKESGDGEEDDELDEEDEGGEGFINDEDESDRASNDADDGTVTPSHAVEFSPVKASGESPLPSFEGNVDEENEENEDDEDEGEDDMILLEDSFAASDGMATTVDSTCSCSHDVIEVDDSDDGEVFIVASPTGDDDERSSHLAELDAALDVTHSQPDEILGVQVAVETIVPFDMGALTSRWSRASSSPSPTTSQPQPTASTQVRALAGASVDQDDKRAEATLARVVGKEDFGTMRVVGQFNLGFVVARRTVPAPDGVGKSQDDLFIIDQHASDEKYNFEKLQLETTIKSQRLIQPRVLNLPSHEEIIAMENLDLLKLNGFEVLVDEDADVGQRVKLVAQPVSKETVFGVEDFEELLDLIGNSSAGEVVRPSKVRKMFASRACRKSVMIGKGLNVSQMTSIIRHMGEMDQPWSCPHGRPTMRWLAGLGSTLPDPRADVAGVLKNA